MKICLKPSPLAFPIQKTENSEIVITSWSFQLFGLFGLVQFQLFSIGQTAADVSANNALYVYLPKKNRGYAPVLAVICTCKTTKEYCMSLAGVKLSFFLPFSKERKKTKKITREGGKALLPIQKLELDSEKFESNELSLQIVTPILIMGVVFFFTESITYILHNTFCYLFVFCHVQERGYSNGENEAQT